MIRKYYCTMCDSRCGEGQCDLQMDDNDNPDYDGCPPSICPWGCPDPVWREVKKDSIRGD